MSKKVAVLLFTYNERDSLEKTVKDILNVEKDLPGFDFNIVIADSHSPDGTGDLAKRLSKENKKIHTLDVGRGIGVAIVEGHKYSLKNLDPDVLAQIDADGQVGIEVLPRLIKTIDEGYDLALGSRFVKGGKNQLSFTRQLFSYGSSLVCRILMGPWDIAEVTNSARAFTPELFKKINFDRIPWREQSFIYMPAFLHEAVLAGAKYKEVPLIFKNRAEGYSKNKVFNYSYDMVCYALDARLNMWGLGIPLWRLSRRFKTFFKFGLVGFVGTMVDLFFYNVFIKLLLIPPATSKGMSAEIAIINNFLLNNFWTFKHRSTGKSIWYRFGIFNLVSLGGIMIAVLEVKLLHNFYGDGYFDLGFMKVAFYNLYFLATIPPVMIWNFLANNFITFKNEED